MRTIVFFLEEPSAREMLLGLLPRILGDKFVLRFVVFEGKQDLNKQLVRRLRGWKQPESSFVVLRDQDAQECTLIKKDLTQKGKEAGHPKTVVRIACRELESWYFGDLSAVERALELKNLSQHKNHQSFRIPDEIVNPARELRRITNNRYQKVLGSRKIGNELNTDTANNSSHSFGVFIASIGRMKQ